MRLRAKHLFTPGWLTWLVPALVVAAALVSLAACAAPTSTPETIPVTILADGQTLTVEVPAGSSVQRALQEANITLNTLDRVEPPAYTLLNAGDTVRVVRVTETFEVKQVVLPYERRLLRNESLPAEQEILIQSGKNGLQEITYRRLFEDGVEVSSQPMAVNVVILEEPRPEIRMIGVQSPFKAVEIVGELYYLRDGNLWRIEESTINRRAVVTTGDMDGRILSISDDGQWVLFTRRPRDAENINELWAAYIGENTSADQKSPLLVDLGVANVIHFADWAARSNNKIYFSTVEPRPTAPGWQANNDLHSLTFSPNGWTTRWTTILEANAGGIYGWWGTQYLWDSERQQMAYSRPDSIGLVDYKNGVITKTLDIIPYQTFGDWAWVPGLTWGPDGKALYLVEHATLGASASPESSPDFSLAALLIGSSQALRLVDQSGMFAYPLASPMQERGGSADYQIAFLQAQYPEQSQTSRYRVVVMDRDGSNRRVLFPNPDSPGLEPQQHWGAWSPGPLPGSQDYALAILYQGNLWLVNVSNGEAHQVTGDGLTTRVLWR